MKLNALNLISRIVQMLVDRNLKHAEQIRKGSLFLMKATN